MIYCLSLVQHNNYFLLQKMLWEQALDVVKRDRHVQCIIDESDAFVLYTFKAINLFFVGQKLLSKNAICVRMNLREMSKLSLAANIKKYIVQTFEPCVKQRFAPKLAVCYWLYNVNLIKNPKLFIILVWRGGPTSSERGSSIAKTWWSCPLLWASHMESL